MVLNEVSKVAVERLQPGDSTVEHSDHGGSEQRYRYGLVVRNCTSTPQIRKGIYNRLIKSE